MKQSIKALEYALTFDLKRDLFVFRRTVRMLKLQVERSKPSDTLLQELEQLLIEKGLFNKETLEEYEMGIKMEHLFGEHPPLRKFSWDPKRSTYVENLTSGIELLEAIRDKKKGVYLTP